MEYCMNLARDTYLNADDAGDKYSLHAMYGMQSTDSTIVNKPGISQPVQHARMMDLASTSSDSSHSHKRSSAEDDSHQSGAASKKQRLTWTGELHSRFLAAVKTLGVSNAVPQKILRMMNVKGLTRDQVASHLQKYRLQLKRLAGLSDDACLDVDTIAALQQTQDGLLTHSNGSTAPLPSPSLHDVAAVNRAPRVSPFAMPEQDIQARLCVALHSSKNESKNESSEGGPPGVYNPPAWSCDDVVSSRTENRTDNEEETSEPVVNFLPVATPQGLLLIPLSYG